MATCSLAELQAKACDNGFTCLDDVTSRAIELELWYKLAGSTTTVSQLIKAACESGFACGNTTDENILAATELQLLCQIKNNNVTPPEPEPCTNIIPDGAMYDDTGAYFTAAVSGITYTITPGDNDGSYSNNGQYPEQLFSGVPVNVTVLNTLELINPLGTPLPVTAVICAVTTTQFDIDASAGVGGSISPSGTTTVNAGDDATFTATPEPGYVIGQWLLDGNVVDGTDASYTISGVNSDHTITVEFTKIPTVSNTIPIDVFSFSFVGIPSDDSMVVQMVVSADFHTNGVLAFTVTYANVYGAPRTVIVSPTSDPGYGPNFVSSNTATSFGVGMYGNPSLVVAGTYLFTITTS